MTTPISITAIASISPLGTSLKQAWVAYQNKTPCFTQKEFSCTMEWVGPITPEAEAEIEQLRTSDSKYKSLDESVLFAMLASRKAIAIAGWQGGDNFGINIGSSRGATALFEQYHSEFLANNRTSTLASPTTTLGNISSWVGHDLQTQGPEISHSITCSTALHSLLNGVAWLKSGMATKFLVGGSEAPLTPFTIAQMKALKIYAPNTGDVTDYPNRALQLNKTKNTMILGEGASVACLEIGVSQNTLATIIGVGYATEILKHNISISSDALCFQRSMKMALGTINPNEIDVIVMHSPGTIKGDISEFKAIEKVFCNKTPFLTTNKWKVGHTFGTSGMLSIEMAVLMLQYQNVISVPYTSEGEHPKQINTILVNAVGFGGNAVSVLLKRGQF